MALAVSNEKVSIMFNSKNRSSGTISNYVYNIDKEVKRITEIQVASVIIPYSFYAFNATNNTFDTSLGTVTITEGNYTANNLTVELQTQLQTLDPAMLVTYSTITQKITITNTSAFSVLITGTASTALGFTVATGAALSHEGDSLLNVSGPLYLVVKSNFLSRALAFRNVYTDNSYDTSLINVPINAGIGEYIILTNSTTRTLGLKLDISATDDIDIELVDADNNSLDLNGIDWSIDILATLE